MLARSHGYLIGLLGWSVRPGALLVASIVILILVGCKSLRLGYVIALAACFLGAVIIEYLGLSRPLCSWLGIIMVICGEAFVFQIRKIGPVDVLFLLTGAYIQAVHLYNLFLGGQMMYFFRTGWTA